MARIVIFSVEIWHSISLWSACVDFYKIDALYFSWYLTIQFSTVIRLQPLYIVFCYLTTNNNGGNYDNNNNNNNQDNEEITQHHEQYLHCDMNRLIDFEFLNDTTSKCQCALNQEAIIS